MLNASPYSPQMLVRLQSVTSEHATFESTHLPVGRSLWSNELHSGSDGGVSAEEHTTSNRETPHAPIFTGAPRRC